MNLQNTLLLTDGSEESSELIYHDHRIALAATVSNGSLELAKTRIAILASSHRIQSSNYSVVSCGAIIIPSLNISTIAPFSHQMSPGERKAM